MKRLGTLRTLAVWPRPNRWADLRRFPRSTEEGRFAGLRIRGRHHIVRLHNWSAGGACVEWSAVARLGERVRIIAGPLRRSGRICWIAGGRAGIEFDG